MKSDLLDIDVELHHETDAAYRVSTNGEDKNAIWIPKSQCEMERQRNGAFILTCTERVAIDKGLI